MAGLVNEPVQSGTRGGPCPSGIQLAWQAPSHSEGAELVAGAPHLMGRGSSRVFARYRFCTTHIYTQIAREELRRELPRRFIDFGKTSQGTDLIWMESSLTQLATPLDPKV